MYPSITLLGKDLNLYNLCFILGLITVPIVLFSLRRRFQYSRKQAAFYSLFTLVFGYLSAMITAWIENGLLTIASNGAFDEFEKIRNYGIPMFLPVFLFIYCLFFRDTFRKLSDYIAPCVLSVMTFVKLGCVFEGCCRGAADPHGIMNVELGYKTFPVQVYDTLSMLAIFFICITLIQTPGKKHVGYVYPIGGMLYAATKGFWEIFRVHNSVWEKNFFNTGWTFWQFWMLILFVGCLIWLLLAIRWEKKVIPDFDEMQTLKLPNLRSNKITNAISSKMQSSGFVTKIKANHSQTVSQKKYSKGWQSTKKKYKKKK